MDMNTTKRDELGYDMIPSNEMHEKMTRNQLRSDFHSPTSSTKHDLRARSQWTGHLSGRERRGWHGWMDANAFAIQALSASVSSVSSV